MTGPTAPAPAWFTRAIETIPREDTIAVDGCPIHYLDWGDPADPGLVFVHGGAAHAHWWSFLAPLFLHQWRVVALDLSGHGDSGRRDEYTLEAWADEIAAVIEHAGFPGPVVVVGHSLGGRVTIQTAVNHCDLLTGAVIVDAPVRRPDPESEAAARRRVFLTPGTYDTLDEALRHFRLVPPQPAEHQFIIDHIARHSLQETEQGWTWKFDPALFRHTMVSLRDQLSRLRCRVALFHGEMSVVVPPDTAAYMYEMLGRVAPVVSIPEAHHHLTLDQPLAFVAALRTLLHDWEHSVPRRPRY